MKTEVLILGGGLAGLSTARHLGGLGARSRLVVEARDRVGGTAGSRTAGGFTFDYTGHLLHLHDPYGKALILDLLKDNVASHERRAWIYSSGAWTRYPFQANTRGLPFSAAVDCAAGTVRARRAARTSCPGAARPSARGSRGASCARTTRSSGAPTCRA
jgi:protoporphyrinogen oxidase